MRLEELGIIGNCQISALVHVSGSLVWACMPRFDAEPLFGALLDERDGGLFAISPADARPGIQRYIVNTNVLETHFEGDGWAFRVIDFAPRFVLHGRSFRPTKIVRIVDPIHGIAPITARCDPRLGWSKGVPQKIQGSNHLTYAGFAAEVRLTTDVPLSYLDGSSFALTERKHFVLSWGEPVEEPLAPLCERFLSETRRYWERWVKHCNVPPRYQQEVIRSALTLKLHCFEDTGAIVAAMTTSLPESPGAGRTWDYRHCWLRDSFYTLNALRLLGHFEEREQFIEFLLNVVATTPTLDLAPVYRIDGRADLDETVLMHWPGYLGEGPVRVGNGAALHQQYDVYGEMVLALSRVFFDDRFEKERTPSVWNLLVALARKAVAVAGTPDAGIWELRTEWQPQTFSSLMCWAAADRAARIAATREPALQSEFEEAARAIRAQILDQAWNAEKASLVATYGGTDIDAALLQAAPLRLLDPRDPRLSSTIDAVMRELGKDGWLLRYRVDDGFGTPEVAFVLCTFWLVEALCVVGRTSEAKVVMDRACNALSPLLLLAEDWDPTTRRLWGNFPQTYSHVGLIHAAFAVSPQWSEVL
ncbi:MAG: glycoside hydrolase family 15 protein [Polyangiaceae bacterium]